MEENATNKTGYTKDIGCPGCGQPLGMELKMQRIEDDLYMWYEGLCGECRHKVADPMPLVRAEPPDEAWKILSN